MVRIKACLLLLVCASLTFSNVIAEREFYLRVRAIDCSGLVNKDTSWTEQSRGERTLSDTIIQLNIEGFSSYAAQAEYYQENSASPTFSWTTNIISGVRQNSLITFKLTDYDYFSPPNDPMGDFSYRLPNTVSSWDVDKFGRRGKFGSALTANVVNGGTGTCRVQIQYYAAQCEPGEYVDAIGMCQSCEAGSYCSDGVVGLQCEVGTFSSAKGSKTCTPCSPGTFQGGRGRQECLPCPAGEYQSASGKASCTKCPAGTYGEAGKLRKNAQCDGLCAEGFYCQTGSPSKTQFECGSPSVYCPAGSANYREAGPGEYTTGGSSATTRTGKKDCEPGFKCQNGVREACEAGSYQNAGKQGKCKTCKSSCVLDQFLNGCGGSNPGTCSGCRVTKDNYEDPSVCPDAGTVSYQKCDGKGFEDNSDCAKCVCDESTAEAPQYKIRQEGKCSTCANCDFTEADCNGDNYLVDECKADGSTYANSKCKECKCDPGSFITACGGSTTLQCSGCVGKKQCGADQYLDPAFECDGTTREDTTLNGCKECSEVVVPDGYYMVNCQASGMNRFEKISDCEDGVTTEDKAPTRTTDRKCKLCKSCNFPFEYEFWPCSNGEGDTRCRAVSEPGEGDFVFGTASFDKDTDIRPYTDCTKLGRFFDTTEMPFSGNSTTPGRDWSCLRYTKCDLKIKFVEVYPTNVSDYNCTDLTDCTEYGKAEGSRAFEIVENTESEDRVCQLCANYQKGSKPDNVPGSVNFNQTYADLQYDDQCAEKLINTLSTGEIAAIASTGVAAAFACLALALVAQRKRRLANEKREVERDLDRAQDDLELADHMQNNPLNAKPPNSDAAELEKLLGDKNREINKLRGEIRRLKMMHQKNEVGSFKGVDIEMAHPRKGKKQFGQQQLGSGKLAGF